MEPFWEDNEQAPHSVKYESDAAVSSFPYCPESSLNFSTSTTAYSEDDAEHVMERRNKTSRQDPLSHRIIEKRRRDRMNSCLADLSRLIPPQYQRKSRGRIEKTEIIEMAIRHLKHLQNGCVQKETDYRMGYTDCMKEAAKFLCDSQMQEYCYRMLTRLQDHCDEVLIKRNFFKAHCPSDNVSASSGSPRNGYHYVAAPLTQLQDILASDVDHSNSIDNSDVKDLSFRNSHSHQTPIVTSTAPPSFHHDSSNHDFDASREPLIHNETANMHSPTPNTHNSDDNLLMQAVRMRNLSESSHDIEHNINYKYKNHIKERFNQDHLHDETSSEYCPPVHIQSDISEHSKDDVDVGSSVVKKRNLEDSGILPVSSATSSKAFSFSYIKSELNNSSITSVITEKQDINTPTAVASRHFAVPIFALHGHGTYYVPLNIDYNSLVPYLNGINLMDKNYSGTPVLHPININVDFAPTRHIPNKNKVESNTYVW
ncbi:transcription factor cwo isoform X2 [Eupeodes corollae]|nr:transcription factor cwo isoform X2 [Eupeodes corollae]XP_055903723.1 transcription factor cwo isoform X2 [Eupeodes corollae]XP_055903724.1 transcription factor cwo isoform X2 [Eupeodes corollae]XP_055903725.1 transcription factor cwo isoform X2 [Eupeodes corollae]